MARMCAETHCEGQGSGMVLTESCTQKRCAAQKWCATSKTTEHGNNPRTTLHLSCQQGTCDLKIARLSKRQRAVGGTCAEVTRGREAADLPWLRGRGGGRLLGATAMWVAVREIQRLCMLACLGESGAEHVESNAWRTTVSDQW